MGQGSSRKVKEIAQLVGGEVSGDGDALISGINGIREASEGDIAFILSKEYAPTINMTKASCVIIPRILTGEFKKSVIKVDNPSIAFSKIVDIFMPGRIPHPRGIHPAAIVAKNAKVASSVTMGPYVVVEDGASIGEGTSLYPFSYIGHNTVVGKNCVIYPNVTIREGVSIGNRVIIHAGSAIGSDGFGYDTDKDGTHVKIPQLGTVVIEDDVEIGSCVTIDRARFAKTIISKGCKIDNLVQIAHNVKLGPNCIMAGQSGISGSSEIGRNVILAGQVGLADHVKLGDFCVVGAKSGVSKSFPAKTTLFGIPAKPIDKMKERFGHIALLPKLFERVTALEKKLKELEGK